MPTPAVHFLVQWMGHSREQFHIVTGLDFEAGSPMDLLGKGVQILFQETMALRFSKYLTWSMGCPSES